MSKTLLRLFIVGSLFTLTACTSTVRGVNYELYKGRLRAQTYFTGRVYKPLPMMASRHNIRRSTKRVQRVSNQRQRYQSKNNRVRPAVTGSRRMMRKPVIRMGKVYKPPIVYRTRPARAVTRRSTRIQPRTKPRIVYQRPIVRKPYIVPRRPVYQRPIVRKPYIAPRRPVYQRPVVHKPYVAPRKKAVYQRPVAPQIPLSELNDALFSAAKAGNTAQINALLAQGAQVNSYNMSRETPLHAAAALGRSGAVSLLLQKGANPNATTTGGWTPLHSAARFKHTQVAKLLVVKGAQVNRHNSQGKTPVVLATQVGATATAAALMALGGR